MVSMAWQRSWHASSVEQQRDDRAGPAIILEHSAAAASDKDDCTARQPGKQAPPLRTLHRQLHAAQHACALAQHKGLRPAAAPCPAEGRGHHLLLAVHQAVVQENLQTGRGRPSIGLQWDQA